MKHKKIIVLTILVLILIIALSLTFIFIHKSKINVAEDQQNVIAENPENLLENNVLDEDVLEENNVITEEVNNSTPTVTEETSEPKTETKTTTGSSTKKEQTTKPNTQTQPKQEQKQETTPSVSTSSQEVPKVVEEKPTPTPSPTPEPPKEETKYVRNDAMINRIKSVIENNPSEYMLEHGYNIVVDSSIKNKTNQFTFSETRVKGFITYRFGTIRIYAEDYYKNGQLIMTECYIY